MRNTALLGRSLGGLLPRPGNLGARSQSHWGCLITNPGAFTGSQTAAQETSVDWLTHLEAHADVIPLRYPDNYW